MELQVIDFNVGHKSRDAVFGVLQPEISSSSPAVIFFQEATMGLLDPPHFGQDGAGNDCFKVKLNKVKFYQFRSLGVLKSNLLIKVRFNS